MASPMSESEQTTTFMRNLVHGMVSQDLESNLRQFINQSFEAPVTVWRLISLVAWENSLPIYNRTFPCAIGQKLNLLIGIIHSHYGMDDHNPYTIS